MRKFVKVLALALSLALSLLFADAALADSRVRTLQDIKDSGTLVIGVFWVWSLSWFPWMPPTAWSI